MITPEQARAMVRAAVRLAREMPEAGEDAIVARVLAEAGAGQPGFLQVPEDLAKRWLLARFDLAWNRVGPLLSRKREQQIRRLRVAADRLAAVLGQAMGLPVKYGLCQGHEEYGLVYTPTGLCVEGCCEEAADALVAALSGAGAGKGEGVSDAAS